MTSGSGSGSKERITAATGELLARHGYNGMGLKAVSEAAGLPPGSIYHHFPGGKEEIAAAAITSLGGLVCELLDGLFSSRPPDQAVEEMFAFMAQRLAESDWTVGCPIGTPAQDAAPDSPQVRAACDQSLTAMVTTIAAALTVSPAIARQSSGPAGEDADDHAPASALSSAAGVSPEQAHALATTIIASYEGAALLAKVHRDPAPLHTTARTLATLLRSQL